MEINKNGLQISVMANLDHMHGAKDKEALNAAYKKAQRDIERAFDLYNKAIEFNELYATFTQPVE